VGELVVVKAAERPAEHVEAEHEGERSDDQRSADRRDAACHGCEAIFFQHEHAALVAPVHARFEVGARPAPLEDEHQPQHVLVEERDVRRVNVELRREIEQ
jgi:hypothetical protein